jgi:hypothetical protein
MRTAAANEDSLVQDGQPLALPPSPALSTRNTVIAAGAALQVYASGTDTILWEEQATPQTGSVTITAGRSLTFFYALGIWYIVAEGNVASPANVTSYNGRQGVITSQLSDVGTLFGAKGQIIGGTGANAAALLTAGATGQALYSGGAGATGMEWAAPITVPGTAGSPSTGTWLQGQMVLDVNAVIWICTVAGTPGTWTQYRPLLANPVGKCVVSSTATQSGGVTTQTPFGNFIMQKGGVSMTSTGLQVPVAGFYQVTALYNFANTGAVSTYLLTYSINGSQYDWLNYAPNMAASAVFALGGTSIASCNANDVIGTQVISSAAAFTYNNAGAGSINYLEVELVSI